MPRKQPFIQRHIVDKMGGILKLSSVQSGMERENTETVVYCIVDEVIVTKQK